MDDDSIVEVEEVHDGRDDASPRPRGAVLIDEEWRDEDKTT